MCPTTQLIEAVPNISIGRDGALAARLARVVDAAMAAAGGVARGRVADVHVDADHDRAVLTLIGTGDGIVSGMRALAHHIAGRVDLARSSGVHPRVGVIDVAPIVPLDGLVGNGGDIPYAAQVMSEVANAVASELDVPCVRYGLDDGGRSIPGAAFAGELRRRGGDALEARLADGSIHAIAGVARPHPAHGVTLVGVRGILVAVNVDLDGGDLDRARAIAGRVRERSAGADSMPGVRALGLALPGRGVSQVSMNVERPMEVGPGAVVDRVLAIAREVGAHARRVELVGLVPRATWQPLLDACAEHGVELASSDEPTIEQHAAALVAGSDR